MNGYDFHKWFRIALFNLMILAAAGVLLRMKIIFSLPWIDQKFLLHGHSHFAFSGWISFALMVLMSSAINTKNGSLNIEHCLRIQLLAAYGMLISFFIQGYGFASIAFSALSIVNAIFFTVLIWKDLSEKSIAHAFFKSALIFQMLSSIGTFFLAYLMMNKIVHQNWYLLSVYFFLHFQYNGWFIFTLFGLILKLLATKNIFIKHEKLIFILMLCAVFPAYFLSALWLSMPSWLYWIVVLSTIAQCFAWGLFLMDLKNAILQSANSWNRFSIFLFRMSALAYTAKIVLQLISTIPSLSQYAFGFRPVVIGYLHLVFLGVITLFILGYAYETQLVKSQASTKFSISIFFLGILLNEVFLMLQGASNMSGFLFPFGNEMLLLATITMLVSVSALVISQFKINRIQQT